MISLDEFNKSVGNKNIIALDIGKKYIGMAIGSKETSTATPFKTIKTSKKFTQTATEIIEILKQENINHIICGLPLLSNGGISKEAQSIKQFMINLKKIYDIKYIFIDEKYTTEQAKTLKKQNPNLNNSKKQHLDELSAQIILQEYLDYGVSF